MDGVAIGTVIAAIGGIITLFIRYISSRDKAQEKRDQVFATALATNTAAMQQVAKSTDKSAKEAKERNGHLAELAIENNRNNQEHNERVIESLARIELSGSENTQINAQALQILKNTQATLKQNTTDTRQATEAVATALITAAEKAATQPIHIEQQTVDHQTVGEISKT